MIDIDSVREALDEMKARGYTVDLAFIDEALRVCSHQEKATKVSADLRFIVDVLTRAAIYPV